MNETMGQVEKKPLLGLIANYLREETSTAIYHNPDKLRHVYASQAEKLIKNCFKCRNNIICIFLIYFQIIKVNINR